MTAALASTHAGALLPSGRARRPIDAWRRRSRIIRFWRRALPAAIAVIVIGVLLQLAAQGLAGASPSGVIAEAEIRIVNPRFLGRDAQGRAFELTAREAIRVPDDETQIRLIQPNIVLQDADGPLTVRSRQGVWRERDEVAVLTGEVVMVDQAAGTTFQTEQAVVETRIDRVWGNTPVVGTGPDGRVSANRYALYNRGDRVVLRGDVRIRMNNGGSMGRAAEVGLR